MKRLWTAILCVVVIVPIFSIGFADDQGTPSGASFAALIYSKTNGFRHTSIRNGIAAIQQLGEDYNFLVDATEDQTYFTDDNLAYYSVVIFLSTTGNNILNADQKAAFERYIQSGGGFVGIHSASDTEYNWAWYGQLVGAYFNDHPNIQRATIHIEDPNHPATASLPDPWIRTDEWYNVRPNPRANVHVLATLDETSYQGGTMGADHPITWCHDYDGGRAWYTALGHTEESYSEPQFLDLLLGGILTAAGVKAADCSTKSKDLNLIDPLPDPLDLVLSNEIVY